MALQLLVSREMACWPLSRLCCRMDRGGYFLLFLVLFFLQLQFLISYLFLLHPSSVTTPQSSLSSNAIKMDLGVIFTNPSSTLPSSNVSTFHELPSFTEDYSDYIFSAIIVRNNKGKDHNMDHKFTLTMFALSWTALKYHKGVNRIHPKAEKSWKKMESLHSIPRGSKQSDRIFCHIAHRKDSSSYVVKSTSFTSTNMSEDSANDVIDIITCPMQSSPLPLQELIEMNEYVSIELYRQSYATGAYVSLLNFTIPWKTRRTGYMLSPPSHEPYTPLDHHKKRRIHISNNSLIQYSYFPAWSSFPFTDSFYLAVSLSNDRVTAHLIGSAVTPSISSASLLLEFIYHHISIGFKHIFLAVKYSFGSARMRSLLLILRHAIESGYVTVVSQSSDGIDGTSSTHGMTWTEIFLKHYHYTVCYYLLKGMSDESTPDGAYLAMWGLDSFLIPLSPSKTVQEIFSSQDSRQKINHNLRGSHNLDISVPCYALVSSEKIIDKFPPLDNRDDHYFPWLIDRFSQGESYFLHNLETQNMTNQEIYHAAIRSIETEGTNGTLYDDYGLILPLNTELSFAALPTSQYCSSLSLSLPHSFLKSSILYRIMSRNYHFPGERSVLIPATDNEYVTRYSSQVLRLLRNYNLDLLVLSNLITENKLIGPKDEHWKKYSHLENSVVIL